MCEERCGMILSVVDMVKNRGGVSVLEVSCLVSGVGYGVREGKVHIVWVSQIRC